MSVSNAKSLLGTHPFASWYALYLIRTFFIWEAMKEHPQPFDKKIWKPANTTGILWEQAHILCVHLFSHKQGDRQKDAACESRAYLGQYHWGIIYYCRESTCTSSFHQEEKLTVWVHGARHIDWQGILLPNVHHPLKKLCALLHNGIIFFPTESGKKFNTVEEQISKQGAQSYAYKCPLQLLRGKREREPVIPVWLIKCALCHPVECLSFLQLNNFLTEKWVNFTLETFSYNTTLVKDK